MPKDSKTTKSTSSAKGAKSGVMLSAPKTTKRTTTKSASAIANRLTKEAKLEKSLKNLSHMGGGAQNMAPLKETRPAEQKQTRRKVGGVVLDIDTIQDASQQKLQTRGKRNVAVIATLSILLIISLAYLAFAVVTYLNTNRNENCFYTVSGNVDAEWIVEGGKDTSFVIQDGISNEATYIINSNLKVNDVAPVSLIVTLTVKYNGTKIDIFGLTGLNEKLVKSQVEPGRYTFNETIVGGGTIHLFEGVSFEGAPSGINSKNITIEIDAYLTKNINV